MNRDKRGSEVARRKKHSTLTSGKYHPNRDAVSADYCGVFVEGEPYLLIRCDGQNVAQARANSLIESSNFRTLLRATRVTREGLSLETRHLSGGQVDWSTERIAISVSRSGDVESGTSQPGEVRAIVMSVDDSAVAETLCIDRALAPLLDSGFPDVADFGELPELTERDQRISLGVLQAKTHSGEGH